ncbi:two-component regulator propeller domain-containing protein, partial [Bacteroidota bacterium]
MRPRVIVTILFQFLLILLFAENDLNISFKHLTTNEGLSQSRINCIFQDSRGFIWIGTDDGLNLYNGYGITIFNNTTQNSISGNYVFDIIEDENMNLLIATNEGVDMFNPIEEIFTPIVFLDPDTMLRIYIKKLHIDEENRIWAISHAKAFIIHNK